MRTLVVLSGLLLGSVPGFCGAIEIDGVCHSGNCASPDILPEGQTTYINSGFYFTLPDGDTYSLLSFIPVTNYDGLPVLDFQYLGADYIGNVDGDPSESTPLR